MHRGFAERCACVRACLSPGRMLYIIFRRANTEKHRRGLRAGFESRADPQRGEERERGKEREGKKERTPTTTALDLRVREKVEKTLRAVTECRGFLISDTVKIVGHGKHKEAPQTATSRERDRLERRGGEIVQSEFEIKVLFIARL